MPGLLRAPLIIGVLLLCAAAVLFPAIGRSAPVPVNHPQPTTSTALAAPAAPSHPAAPKTPGPTTEVPAPAGVVIRLHPGDTLWALAHRYRTTVTALQLANGLAGSTRIYAGTSFHIPAGTVPVTASARSTPSAAAVHRASPHRGLPAQATTTALELPAAGSVQQAAAAAFGRQYVCAANIITRESGWNIHASNPVSGAYGLAQALPGTKMAADGPDWRTNPATQLAWMRDYVTARYGGACGAWSFWQTHHWY